MDKTHKKQIKRYIAWGCAAVVVLLLAVMPLAAAPDVQEEGPQESILSVQAERTDITKKLMGGGILASREQVTLEIPAQVKLKEYLVGNGDVVSQGNPIAVVDRVSVMAAIAQIQETLDYLNGQLETARTQEAPRNITSRVKGTVKHLYAQEGDDVREVMLEHGALAVISLDGLMAVEIQYKTDLTPMDRVYVAFGDGTQADGTVASNVNGALVVTVEDRNYPVGETVTVTTEDGHRIGSGELGIHSPWNVHGSGGTVFSIQTKEGQSVYSGQTLLWLVDTGSTAEYEKLVEQRREYEAMMQSLFRMYDSGTMDAPCDGIVSGVDTDGMYMLSGGEADWQLSLLTNTPDAGNTGYVVYAARVQAVEKNGLTLLADPQVHVIETLGGLSGIPVETGKMTELWNYTGSTRVYTLGRTGIPEAGGYADAGDILLFVGDLEEIRWIFRVDTAWSAVGTSAGTGFRAVRLSEEEPPEEGEPPTEEEPPGGEGEAGGDVPQDPPAATYWGYVARVKEVGADGSIKVMQTGYAYSISDLAVLPTVSADDLTVERIYPSLPAAVAVDDLILIIVDAGGSIVQVSPATEAQQPAGGMPGGFDGMTGGMGGMGGASQPVFEPYSLDTLAVATVTSQEVMTLDITVDEADVLLLHVGQEAELLVSALGGMTFDAVITEISNNGSNAGGRTKFTVTATADKYKDMYPGMTCSLTVELDTARDVVALPVAALVEEGTRTLVYTGYDVEKEELTGPVEVTTGISDGEMVEVLNLKEGTTVYYGYYDTLVQSNTPENGGFFR